MCRRIEKVRLKLPSSDPFHFLAVQSCDGDELVEVQRFNWKKKTTLCCNLPTPKKIGVMKIDVIGVKLCNSNGNMQARKVNSSDSGATMWFRIQRRLWK